ncbi:MAG: HWE histidine kinase domain-containing protein [Pseudomonadota bacterium]
MSEILSDFEIDQALNSCADEQIHTPGTVQTYGCLIAVHPETRVAHYASANTEKYLRVPAEQLLGMDLGDFLGNTLWHSVHNTVARSDSTECAAYIGDFQIRGRDLAVHAFVSQGLIILELEPTQSTGFSGPDGLQKIAFLMGQVERCKSEQALFDLMTRLLRHMTGYDRVMVYRFDTQWNGEVFSEDRRHGLQSFLGLRFPHWDIPAQARAMMARLPVRFIADVEQTPVPLLGDQAQADALDISLAFGRGVSGVHMDYLRNMGVASTMTLSVKIEDRLWGIVSFHHMQPRVPSPALRDLLVHVGRIFSTKIRVFEQENRLRLVSKVDAFKDDLLSQLGADGAFEPFGKSILDVLDADGLVIEYQGSLYQFGDVPADPLLEQLHAIARDGKAIQSYENLKDAFPRLANATKSVAGALVFVAKEDRMLMVFRKEHLREVAWAGNPKKKIENHSGALRLSPRGSFSAYLDQIDGSAKPWSDQDMYFASRIWTLVNAFERQQLITQLNRQQKVLIDELNHRVRNISAVVHSVSRQASKSSHGSIESYAKSLEARISALAVSHDLVAGQLVTSVPVHELISRECAPHIDEDGARLTISGPRKAIRGEVAPILALGIHELVTNAVKYGAFSNDAGTITVTFKDREDAGLLLEWREQGGPTVSRPTTRGFGSSLILEAVPYELNGSAKIDFAPDGLRADITLPAEVFEPSKSVMDLATLEGKAAPETVDLVFDQRLRTASCLILEDNFLIASETRDQLLAFGIQSVELQASVEAAMSFLDAVRPTFALLDMNLGNNTVSFPVAERLIKEKIPFAFVTGYGDSTKAGGRFREIARLTKPVTPEKLIHAVVKLLRDGL